MHRSSPVPLADPTKNKLVLAPTNAATTSTSVFTRQAMLFRLNTDLKLSEVFLV